MGNLVLKHINKIYPNGVHAVFDFNLEIKDKEFIVFVGPSGCGKSTTLRMVAGLEDITSGEFFIDGELMNQVEPKDRNIAMVFQNYALYPHMTVYKNLQFGLKLRKVDKPLWANPEEVEPINQKIKELVGKINAINRKYKKNQNDDSFLAERTALYSEVYALEDSKKDILKPIIGKDEFGIARYEKAIKKHQKSINKNNRIIARYQEKFPDETKLLAETNEKAQHEIDLITEKITYLQEHEVALYSNRHLTHYEMDIEINKVADSIDLARYLFRKPSALSGGQRQRVALGRAIVRKPKVFLMDEPLSNLDAKLRVQTRSEISKIHKSVGATTIYVTHDQVEAMTMADRIVVMKEGWVQQIGSPKELFNNPANKFVASFIGSPGMNFLDGKIEKGNFVADGLTYKLNKANVALLKDYEGKAVTLGIRPEDVYFADDKNNTTPGQKITVPVDYCELLGYDLMLYVTVAGAKVVAKVGENKDVAIGKDVTLCFDESKIHFFDVETEKSIR